MLVRTARDSSAAMAAIREAMKRIDPRLALSDVRTMEAVKGRSLADARNPTWVISTFALVAAPLAASVSI